MGFQRCYWNKQESAREWQREGIGFEMREFGVENVGQGCSENRDEWYGGIDI